ncbi:MAG: RsmD family RNA methyltransferase [Treponema sp.]|jgi:16S rRNA (guanine(966)-N(2))-methyltransferase RsmD|nr:RsmD family RNA methyltransferase [Treponema sp.]
MRISGGSLRGRQVQVPQGLIRPAMDRMRESVFATLGDLEQCPFLDMFSGSGIIALEAASRGASPIEAVEKDPLKWKTLIRNVAMAPVRIQCRFMATEHYIRRARRSFGVIFCDPPFPYRFKGELVRAIAASPLVRPGSRLLVHRPQEDPYIEGLGGVFSDEKVVLEESKRYGRSVVDFFVWR